MESPNPKLDRRVQRTRDTLGDALVALMQEKDFRRITVQELLDRAGVGRSTFYEHYRNKHDLLVSDTEDFFAMVSTALKRHGANPRRLAPVREFCVHLRQVRIFYSALATSGKIDDVRRLGEGMIARSIEERLQAAGIVADPLKRAAQAHALAGSLFSLLDWWIGRGMGPEPEEIDELFHCMAWNGLAA